MATTVKQASTLPKEMPKEVFAVEVPNHELLKLAYNAYLANGRIVTAKTKTRGEVSGGGKKPWRQKGTGRARFGSSRNPIWRGGGIVFGPRGVENYTKKISKTAKHVALRQALTLASQAGKFVLVGDIAASGKTRDMVDFLEQNKANARHVLVVVDEKTPELLHASQNLQNVALVRATYLTVFHILNADKIVITKAALAHINEWLGATS